MQRKNLIQARSFKAEENESEEPIDTRETFPMCLEMTTSPVMVK